MSRHDAESPRTDVTDAELAVLHALWENAPATVRTLTNVIYPDGEAAHYGTVQKLLQRLEAKECVERTPDRSPLEFTATVSREDLVDLRVQQVVDKLCAGSLTPLLTHLTQRRDLSSAERRELRAFVRGLEARRPRRRKS